MSKWVSGSYSCLWMSSFSAFRSDPIIPCHQTTTSLPFYLFYSILGFSHGHLTSSLLMSTELKRWFWITLPLQSIITPSSRKKLFGVMFCFVFFAVLYFPPVQLQHNLARADRSKTWQCQGAGALISTVLAQRLGNQSPGDELRVQTRSHPEF